MYRRINYELAVVRTSSPVLKDRRKDTLVPYTTRGIQLEALRCNNKTELGKRRGGRKE